VRSLAKKISLAVQDVDVGSTIRGLLKQSSANIRLQALNFVFDRMLGKPKQELGFSGRLVHAHMRDPRLAALSNKALAEFAGAYDQVLAKHAVPVLDAVQDIPHKQIRIKATHGTVVAKLPTNAAGTRLMNP
jgi:hypothetical protein